MYYLLSAAHTDREAIEKTFNGVASFSPPHIGFLARGSGAILFERMQVTPDDPGFRNIASAIEQILIGAYDRESFLRWQRVGGLEVTR
jgi:hypothetical protein